MKRGKEKEEGSQNDMKKESRTIEIRPGTMDPVKQPKIENQD